MRLMDRQFLMRLSIGVNLNRVLITLNSHELTPKEKAIWILFDRVHVADLLARDAFAKGAYMLSAEDREIMLK